MEELSPYRAEEGSRVEVDGPDVSLNPQSAQSIAMVLHELTTNSVKYGALSESSGRIRVQWTRPTDRKLVLHWNEMGGPPVKPPARQGIGTRVIDSVIRAAKGEVSYDWRADGLACEVLIEA
jgi:two-component sensor histidine kinase